MATQSSILARRIHEQRSLAGDSPRVTKSWTRLKQLSKHVHKRGFCKTKHKENVVLSLKCHGSWDKEIIL